MITRQELWEAMLVGKTVTLAHVYNGKPVVAVGHIQAIEREDGSGYSFNVKLDVHKVNTLNAWVPNREDRVPYIAWVYVRCNRPDYNHANGDTLTGLQASPPRQTPSWC